ncbi:MAG TPA: aminotransferase class V-fold PLP-dependent enzyme [bacterium]|nr:aminotransferase class V-fold PLP-dependent enzyme [bacterium]
MPDMIYLDNAATTFPKPQRVYDFMHEFYQRSGVNPGRSGYDAALETEEMVLGTRKMLTKFFNGTDPDRLTFSYNASDSLNMIIQGMLGKGDHAITTNVEHNSVLRPLHHLKHDGVIDVTHVPFDSAGYVDPGDIKKAIKKNTKLVIVNHGSNVIGTVQPIAAIGRVCREAGVFFAIDASQTAGVVDIDVQEMNIDLLAFTGHKCLMGPTGIGGSYIGPNVPVRGTRFGGTGVRSAHPFHLEEFPYRMECGTLNIVGVAGLRAGLEWILEEGTESIHRREMALFNRLCDGLRRIDKVKLYCADQPRDHISVLSLNIEGWEAGDVGTVLDVDYNIACRTGLQCAPRVHVQLGTDKLHGTVRLSIGPFNTEEHIDTAIRAVRDVAAMARDRAVTA